MALGADSMRCGEFHTSYRTDIRIFPTAFSRNMALLGLALLALGPLYLNAYWLSLLIQIGYFSIAALGLNILTGYSGQISLGHAAFFGVGAFTSAWLNNSFGIPVLLCIPLAGLFTTLVGLIFGLPAGRLKGMYLVIATLAAQYIIEDFFNRADWFTGGTAGTMAGSVELFGFAFDTDGRYFYVVLAFLVLTLLLVTNLMRSRDGRAFVALRDHYLSAEIMGINLNKYRILAFGISSFYAGIGGALYAHYMGYVSVEAFGLLLSVQFIGMIIIGGLGSVMGTLLGVIFMVMLPQVVTWGAGALKHLAPQLGSNVSYMQEIAVGMAIVLFLIFEPEGLIHRWKMTKAWWKLYPFSY
ncbi:branched-chain amino acid ABC transporter permease [Castellaniella sp.]|uniref:branched-chain amino acid ABC transporter permease n=1 Tax=Castellaniella sp. TaxID=1955812 RepID=UPI00355D579F